ncbi:MAG: ABC transporter permease [Deltaproteobacteria bacterium]|nr:MAG: ABC transporter permease [Deltaproteobacteria bacterium]
MRQITPISVLLRSLRELLVFFRRQPVAAVSSVMLVLLLSMAIFSPWLAPHDPIKITITQRLMPPSAKYLLGTDELGRDILSRVIYGARISLYVGFLGVLAGTTVGAILGVISAYRGGRTDMYLQRVMDVLLAFPTIILALAIMAVLGRGINNVALALAVPFVARTNRVVRSAALSVSELDYVEAARSIGCTRWRIILRHVLPNCMAPYLIISTSLLGTAILVESSLSFLGLGIPPPHPAWGRSLSEAMPYLRLAPWASIFPGIAISMSVFAVNLLGDYLRDTLDPRLRLR